MLKERVALFRNLSMAADLSAVTAGFYLALAIKDIFPALRRAQMYPAFIPVLLAVWGYLLYRGGMYKSFRTREITELLYIIFKSCFGGLLAICAVMFILGVPKIGRDLVTLLFAVIAALLSLEKIVIVCAFRILRAKGYNYRNILIIGSNKRVEQFIGLIQKHADWGLRITGIVDDDAARSGQSVKGVKILGAFENMAEILHNNVVDEAVFILPRSLLSKAEELIMLCETEGIRISIAADFFQFRISRAAQADMGGFPLFTYESAPSRFWHLIIKRAFDIAVSAAGLLLLLPVFIAVAITIKLMSRGPAFFKQGRCGLNGRRFNLWKFRTMVADAEEKLKGLLAHNEMRGPAFKMKNDPRIIPGIGKLLRKLSVDELPQLWNVLKGDMSIVGPRPPIPSEVSRYDNWQRRRLSMRPGITCLWQVNGRNGITDFEQWARLDLEYIDRWSLLLDFKIFFKTVPVVLFGIGAK